MAAGISYITGIGYPRSGHGMVVRVLKRYFGPDFGYCKFKDTDKFECCKKVPCSRRGQINFSKNHDLKNSVPILKNQKYLIQY